MKYLLMPFHLSYKLYVGVVFWVTLILLYPAFRVLLSKEQWFPKAFRLKRIWSKSFQFLLFCPVKVSKPKEWPKPPYIICSNHSSYFDIILFYSVIPDYFLFIGKGELLNWPLFRLFFKRMDIPVYRDNFVHAFGAFKQAGEALQKGECVAIFPEGTIPWSAPKMKAFKKGAFKLAIEQQVPILPVTWVNNYRRFGEPTDIWSGGHPGIANVVIHEPVQTNGLKEEDLVNLRREVFGQIDSALPEKYRKHSSTHGN